MLTTNFTLINTSPTGTVYEKYGFRNSHLYDPTNDFKYNVADAETVYKGADNTWIVFGRDRPGGLDSGYGGRGHLKSGAIDIVTGRLSSLDARYISGFINSNVGADAARIYLSQKSDVDQNYFLANGVTGKSTALSTVIIKADAVRVIARDSLKIVTNTDANLSNGTPSYEAYGAQFIGNNDSRDMQPIPKGENLTTAFKELADYIEELNGIIMGFLKSQQTFNDAISDHTHFSPFWGLETSLDPYLYIDHKVVLLQQFLQTEQGLKFNINNIESWKLKFTICTGNRYINSFYHYLN